MRRDVESIYKANEELGLTCGIRFLVFYSNIRQ